MEKHFVEDNGSDDLKRAAEEGVCEEREVLTKGKKKRRRMRGGSHDCEYQDKGT